MYEPFPGNYVWNLSVNICIGMGGAIGEIDQANDRVRELAKQGDDTGTEAFFSSWIAMADGVIASSPSLAPSQSDSMASIYFFGVAARRIVRDAPP